MEKYTAQVLIGRNDLGNGGFIPEHQIFLSEDQRPVLILSEIHKDNEWIWFPGKESLMDDIFLMISSVIFRETELKELEKLSLLESYTERERHDYYERVQEKSGWWNKKVIINLFNDSILKDQIHHLEDYSCNLELTTTRYLKEKDQKGNQRKKGHL